MWFEAIRTVDWIRKIRFTVNTMCNNLFLKEVFWFSNSVHSRSSAAQVHLMFKKTKMANDKSMIYTGTVSIL